MPYWSELRPDCAHDSTDVRSRCEPLKVGIRTASFPLTEHQPTQMRGLASFRIPAHLQAYPEGRPDQHGSRECTRGRHPVSAGYKAALYTFHALQGFPAASNTGHKRR